ncbi:hypothetical protein B0T09DRAFT_283926, partial [Sordaria sp. MPI-SDFR-AT-0083]
MERNRHSSSGTTAFSGASTMESDPTSFPEMEGEYPCLPNLWICGVDLTDDQELIMEHLIEHLNHPRILSSEATADAVYSLMPLKTVPEGNGPSDTLARPLSSNSMELRHPAASVMREFWCIFDVAKNVPHWHPAQERLQNLIKKLADLYETDAEVTKKEWTSRENDGRGTNPSSHRIWWDPLPYFLDSLFKFVLPYPRDERDQDVMWHWTNFSWFQARTAATGPHSIIPAATWVLRAALEDFHPVTIEQ